MDPSQVGHVSAALAAICGVADAYGGAGIAVTLFGAGLVGSFAHCAPMCGPFVMMQLTAPEGGGFALRKLTTGALPGYQLGRLTTYVGLGLLMGGVGGSLAAFTHVRWLFAPLLGLAVEVQERSSSGFDFDGRPLEQLSDVELLQILARGQGMTETKFMRIARGQIAQDSVPSQT